MLKKQAVDAVNVFILLYDFSIIEIIYLTDHDKKRQKNGKMEKLFDKKIYYKEYAQSILIENLFFVALFFFVDAVITKNRALTFQKVEIKFVHND
jgi:hypothetical protein